jgi:exodeoxyribonuclease VII small subunit
MAAKQADKSKPAAEAPTLSFEQALERLEAIVEELESGRLPLETSLERYQEGIRLSRQLSGQLDAAEKTIERLAAEGEAPPRTEPMELDLKGGERNEGQEGLPF